MLKKITLKSADFKVLLHDFEDLVSDKLYYKMDYYMWRKISSALHSNEICVFIEWDYHAVDITFGEESERHRFMFGDNSFGDFIWENLLTYGDYEHDYNASYLNLDTTTNEAIINCGDRIKAAEAVADKYNNNDKKENNTMKFNFDFGPVNANAVRMSVYSLAVKNKAGTWVSFDATSGNIVDVDVFNFDGAKFLYKMPVAVKDVAVGDVVIHNSAPMFVLAIGEKTLTVVDVVNGERKDIMLTKSPFMFDFVTKVVNLLGNITATADSNNPFGNLLPLLLMDDKDSNDVFMAMMLMNNGNNSASNINPMVLYTLMNNKDKDSNILPLLLMNNMIISNQNQCHCKDNCN